MTPKEVYDAIRRGAFTFDDFADWWDEECTTVFNDGVKYQKEADAHLGCRYCGRKTCTCNLFGDDDEQF